MAEIIKVRKRNALVRAFSVNNYYAKIKSPGGQTKKVLFGDHEIGSAETALLSLDSKGYPAEQLEGVEKVYQAVEGKTLTSEEVVAIRQHGWYGVSYLQFQKNRVNENKVIPKRTLRYKQ